jgi:hypothetical protein
MFNSEVRTASRHTALILAGLAFALSLMLRQIPVLGWLVYPFQLFATLVHELSHGLAALVTGGRFLKFTIAPNTSGLATTAGGWRWFILSAGYLGAALFGGFMLVLIHRSSRNRERRWFAIGLGLFFALITVLFARNLTAIAIGGLAALALLLLGLYGSPLMLLFGLNLLAIQTILNAVDSALGLMRLNAGPFQPPNDAQTMGDLTNTPAAVWAILWCLFAVAILIGSIYLSLRHGDNKVC